MPREEREIVRLAGLGGHIMPSRFDPTAVTGDPSPADGVFLEITRWEVLHRNLLVEDTHSGSGGAILRSLVAQDFTFAATMPWNARLAQRDGSRESVGFLEEILVGVIENDYNVAIVFAIADQLSYQQNGAGGEAERAILWAPKVLLEFARMVNNNEGRDVVRAEFRGSGNSLLRGYRGITQKFNLEVAPAEPAPLQGF